MDPRKVLQERYPEADFSVYFRHIDACRGTKDEPGRTHKHHICPRKQFPEYKTFSENLISLTLEDHDFAHKTLEAVCGIKAPRTIFLGTCRRAGEIGGRVSFEKGAGFHGLSPEEKTENCRKGGRSSGLLNGHNPNSVLALTNSRTKEHQSAAGRRGGVTPKHWRAEGLARLAISGVLVGHNRWHVGRGIVNPKCALCTAKP